MRKLLITIVAIGLSSTVACAGWLDLFQETLTKKGLDNAVADAITDGQSPAVIMESALGLEEENINPGGLVKALYCAGGNGPDIVAAAATHEISELIVTEAYVASVSECGDMVTDVQPYTQVRQRNQFGPSDPNRRRNRPNASPSTP